MEDTTIADLPAGAVQHIVEKARSRSIGGTNTYATVCKRWCMASSGADQEQLRLYMDVAELSDEQLDTAMEWVDLHGQQVVGVDLSQSSRAQWGSLQEVVAQQLLDAPALLAGLTSITFTYPRHTMSRLACNTLGDLMLLSVQLPSLRHLQAAVELDNEVWSGSSLVLDPEQLAAGRPPPMQLLFPALTSLTLDILPYIQVDERASSEGGSDGEGSGGSSSAGNPLPEELLPVLLPRTLQRLQLCVQDVIRGEEPELDVGECLKPFTQLRHLGLANFLLLGEVPSFVEQLHLDGCNPSWRDDWEPYAAILVQLGEVNTKELLQWQASGALHRLTKLAWRIDVDSQTLEPVQRQQVQALQQLQRLRHLELTCVLHGGAAFEELTALTGLQQLRVVGIDSVDLLAALGKLTQVTALDVGSLREGWLFADSRQQHPTQVYYGNMLQQLTGLRQLSVPEHLLEAQGPWLTCLTQLTLLAVGLMGRGDNSVSEWWAGSLDRLQPWLEARPSSLHHLVLYIIHSYSAPSMLPCPVSGLSVMCSPTAASSSWPGIPFKLLQACPHLPGVMEVVEG
jgi:hypothetical protein